MLLVVAFVRYELHQDDPILEPRFLRVGPFAAATASVGLSNLALYGTLLAVPVLLADRPGWSEGEIGLAVGALSFPLLAFSPVGGRLSDRAGRRDRGSHGTGPCHGRPHAARPGRDGRRERPPDRLDRHSRCRARPLERRGAGRGRGGAGTTSRRRCLGDLLHRPLPRRNCRGKPRRRPRERRRGDYGMLFTIEVAAALASTLLALALPGRVTAPAADEAAAAHVT